MSTKKKYIIKRMTHPNVAPVIFQLTTPGTITSLVQSGTANCQISVCYNFQGLLNYQTVEERRNALIALNILDGRKMLLIDVNQVHMPKVEELFLPSHVVFKNTYKSTNGSAMVVYLVRNDDVMSRRVKIVNDWTKENPNKQIWTVRNVDTSMVEYTIEL